jgi:hypothetical protein
MRYVGSGLRKAVEILNRVHPRVPVDLVHTGGGRSLDLLSSDQGCHPQH